MGQSISKLSDVVKTGGFKVILLIRDPRGIANSRFSCKSQTGPGKLWSQSKKDVFWKVGHVCDVYNLFLEEESKETFGIEKRKIFIARYEDMLNDPIRIAERIYSFVGLRMPEQVQTK